MEQREKDIQELCNFDGPADHIPDRPDEEPEGWTDEDQDALDDYNQMLEDLAQDED